MRLLLFQTHPKQKPFHVPFAIQLSQPAMTISLAGIAA
jgi:hypothetical protein